MKKIWFKRKIYGWGWTPTTWQGWLIIATYLALVFANFYRVDTNQHSASDTLINFIPQTFLLTIILIFICYKKGEKPRWQWGKTNVIIVHGLMGTPEDNWQPWLKDNLQKNWFNVIIPQFPNPDEPNLKDWLNEFSKLKKYINKDTILVGHSLGVPLILQGLMQYKVKSAYLVAGFATSPQNKYDYLIKSFLEIPLNFKTIIQNCENFHVYHSDNDHLVEIKKAYELEQKLNAKLTIIKDAGHFNTNSGYTKFKTLLDDIIIDDANN